MGNDAATNLYAACRACNTAAVDQLTIYQQYPPNVNVGDQDGLTPLINLVLADKPNSMDAKRIVKTLCSPGVGGRVDQQTIEDDSRYLRRLFKPHVKFGW